MRGKLIDDVKHALSAALSKLNLDDSFSIIAFNGETYLFSTSMTLASKDNVEKAIEWIDMNFVAGDGTNILQPLNMVSFWNPLSEFSSYVLSWFLTFCFIIMYSQMVVIVFVSTIIG